MPWLASEAWKPCLSKWNLNTLVSKWNLNTLVSKWMNLVSNGSFTLATFVSETVGDSDKRQSPWAAQQDLPWLPWPARQEIETILSVLHCPRWPRQEQWWVSLVAVRTVVAINFTDVAINFTDVNTVKYVLMAFFCRKLFLKLNFFQKIFVLTPFPAFSRASFWFKCYKTFFFVSNVAKNISFVFVSVKHDVVGLANVKE